MQTVTTLFRGLLIFEPRVFNDERGYFLETWNKETFNNAGVPYDFVQDNQSGSVKDVVRGLHFQLPPYEQGKLVRVLAGAVLDIAVDLRKKEPTYGMYFAMVLEASKNQLLFIPPGFAHGFRTLANDTIFSYKCTKVYNSASERAILWNDPALNIDWGITDPLLSPKDKNAQLFNDFDSPF